MDICQIISKLLSTIAIKSLNMAFAIGIKVIKNKKDTDNLIDYQCLLSILEGILSPQKWRWRESNSRPNKEPKSFLHA